MGPHRKRVFSLKDFCLCNHEASLEMPAEGCKHNAVRIPAGKLFPRGGEGRRHLWNTYGGLGIHAGAQELRRTWTGDGVDGHSEWREQ